MIEVPQITYCRKCTYPTVAATPLILDDEGICSGCRTHEEQDLIFTGEEKQRRFEALLKLVEPYRSQNNYDCIVPVSGGKDSFWQVHVVTHLLGMRPLLVCFNENAETAVGIRNLIQIKNAFPNAGYVNYTPPIETLRKMNLASFKMMGDCDWHAHVGIFTIPMQIAVGLNIPLIVWGEHGFMDLGGMHSYNDYVEFTAKYRKEHNLRGFDERDFIGKEGITEQSLMWCRYPSDEAIKQTGLRGIFLSNYLGWKQERQASFVHEEYKFEYDDFGHFSRTWVKDTALNNIHDMNLHDYLRWIKWGYGKATDHTTRLIRQGLMTREDGINKILQYDHAYPNYINIWLEYVGLNRREFTDIANSFRDPRVWVKDEGGSWWKQDIDGMVRNYGPGI